MKVKFDNIAFNSVAKKKPVPEDATHYIGLEHIDSGSFEITRWGSEVAPIGDKLLMKKGDVLFGRRRAYQRKVAIAPFDGIFSAHGMVLRPKTDVVDPGYFPFFIASDQFMNEAVRISVGGLSPTINWKTLKECEFDLPPIEKQQELAELLWAANDLKESYRKMIAATDEMLKAKFREIFGECGVRNAECGVREDSHAEPQSRRAWPTVRFEEICRRGPQNGFYRKGAEKNGTTPTLKMKQLFGHESMSMAKDCDRFSMTKDEIEKYRLTKSDLVFGRRSIVPEGAGKCRRIDKLDEDTVFESSMLRVTLKDELAEPRWVQTWTEWGTGAGEIAKLRSGTTIVGIKGSDLKNMPILLPPLALQQEFVEIARKADETKASLKKSIADVEQVIKGLING